MSRKGIKGRLRYKYKHKYVKNIKDNAEVFKTLIDTYLGNVEYDIYIATFDINSNQEDYIVIDFNILSTTFKECKIELSLFKKEIKNNFGFKPEEYFTVKYDKI